MSIRSTMFASKIRGFGVGSLIEVVPNAFIESSESDGERYP